MRALFLALLALAIVWASIGPTLAEEQAVPKTNRALHEKVGRAWTIKCQLFELPKKPAKPAPKGKKPKEPEAPEKLPVAGTNLGKAKGEALLYRQMEVLSLTDKMANIRDIGYTNGKESSRREYGVLLEGAPEMLHAVEKLGTETLVVAGYRFPCTIYGPGPNEGTSVHWYSDEFPGLCVRSEFWGTGLNDTITVCALTEFAGFPEANKVKESGNAEAGADANPDQKAPSDKWTLFKKQGRKWTLKQTTLADGKEVYRSYTSYEILGVTADSSKLKTQGLDKDKKPTAINNTQDLKFADPVNAMWVDPPRTATRLREEEIEAAGQKFMCVVYEDKKMSPGSTMTYWYARAFPGLVVNYTSKSDKGVASPEWLLEEFTE